MSRMVTPCDKQVRGTKESFGTHSERYIRKNPGHSPVQRGAFFVGARPCGPPAGADAAWPVYNSARQDRHFCLMWLLDENQ